MHKYMETVRVSVSENGGGGGGTCFGNPKS